MAISRPTLREVLRRLEAERLVYIVANRGAFVARLTTEDLDEIHEVWSMLMGQAVYRFTAHALPEELAALEGSFVHIQQATSVAGVLHYIEKCNRFFCIILAGCRNKVLADSVHSLVSRINFLRARSMVRPTRKADCTREVRDLLTAVLGGERRAAREAARRHIYAACEAARAVLDQSTAFSADGVSVLTELQEYRRRHSGAGGLRDLKGDAAWSTF
jgi:DNA-binding GntR family transcriptional regulator